MRAREPLFLAIFVLCLALFAAKLTAMITAQVEPLPGIPYQAQRQLDGTP
jgi:hypothetical protein